MSKEKPMASGTTTMNPPKGNTEAPRAEDYGADSIQVREGLEHVRTRPAMYIGDIYERGLHHLVNEVVDNSVDEAMAGFCTQIDVTIHTDGSLTVLDDGRGIPVAIHPKVKKPTLEVCLTVLGAGGKFDKGSYKISGGLHGVGVSCVNALSEWLDAEVFREGQTYHMRFERGQTSKQLETLGKTERRGTKITFKPDAEIFKQTVEFKFEKIAKRLRELAYLNAGLKISLRDERVDGKVENYCFPNGVVDFVSDLSGGEAVLLSKPIYLKGTQDSVESKGRVEVEIAVQYNDTYADSIVSYVNNINTIDGGTHETGFRTALTTTLNNYIKENEKVGGKEEERPTGDDYREGLVAVISVKVPEPQFEGQTKSKLGNSDVAGIVQNVVGEFFKAWLEHHPAETKRIINKARQARDARLAAKKAKELVRKTKDALRGGGIAKLKDCESTNPDECELFLVEGDSAGGTACEGRDPRTQAILPLRGKILNVWKSTHEKMLEHNEIANIIQALGTGILDDFDIAKCQFGKVIIMCDADVDGSHIRTLILTFFFRQMPQLILNGHVYCAQPPLYKITYKGKRAAKKDGAEETEETTDDVEGEEAAAPAPKGKKKAEPAKKKGPREVYIRNDSDFVKTMRARGLEGTTMELRAGKPRTWSSAEVARLHDLVVDVRRISEEIKRAGVDFKKYLGRKRADGLLPFAKVVFAGTKDAPAVFTEAEFDALVAKARGENKKVWFSTDPLSERETAQVHVTRFSSKTKLEQHLRELEKLGLTVDLLMGEEPKGEAGPAPLLVKREKEERTLWGLLGLPEATSKLAEHGIQLQRYKGLGEMDSDELAETTMDPEKRQLVKVTLEDMAEANRIFNILMGTKVEPRRDYIERNADSVKNLDA